MYMNQQDEMVFDRVFGQVIDGEICVEQAIETVVDETSISQREAEQYGAAVMEEMTMYETGVKSTDDDAAAPAPAIQL
jgi:hypothetical protein